jgi:hypothetical protein
VYAKHSLQFIPQGAINAVWSRPPTGASVAILFRFVAMGRTWQIPSHFSTAVERWLNKTLRDFNRRSATGSFSAENRGLKATATVTKSLCDQKPEHWFGFVPSFISSSPRAEHLLLKF